MFNSKEYYKQWRKTKKGKESHKKSVAKWKKKNPNYYKEYMLLRRYGISLNEWKKLLEKQNGKCLVCKKLFSSTEKICVDHNHKTGKIRGLLCDRCNVVIGLCDDNIEILKDAIGYIESSRKDSVTERATKKLGFKKSYSVFEKEVI